MTILAAQQPLPIFFDTNGAPVDNGYLYIGLVNQNPETNPTPIFWDAAGTQPAPQPLRLSAGLIYRTGSPANIFVNGSYSMTLKDKDGRLILYVPDASEVSNSLNLQQQINNFSLSSGSSLVGFTQTGIGAVARTVQAKLRESVSVKDFGAVGDGVTNDRNAIQLAFNASKSVYFPDGTYYLGTASTAENIIDLSALGSGISIFCGKSVELVLQTTASVIPRVFYLLNNSNFYCDPIRFRDTGYDSSVTWKGASAFYLDCTTSASWGDVTIPSIYSKNMVASVLVAGGDATNRIRGINIGQIYSDDCYYGINAQNNGDGLNIDNLVAVLNYRPYYVYGCTGHKVTIYNRNNRAGSGAINISRSVGGLNTQSIDVTYTARDMSNTITHVLVNHIDLLGGSISNIKLRVDIKSAVVYSPIRFVNYTGSGGSETNAASNNLVYDVDISGSCDVQASPITVVASYASKLNLTFNRGSNLSCDPTVFTKFYLDFASRQAAVTWTGSISNPAIGNGTMFMDYDIVGGMCTCTINMTAGGTTTFGSGEWFFSLPFASTTTAIGSVFAYKNATAYYAGVCKVAAGANAVQAYSSGSGSAFTATNPFAWGSADQLRITITYPVS